MKVRIEILQPYRRRSNLDRLAHKCVGLMAFFRRFTPGLYKYVNLHANRFESLSHNPPADRCPMPKRDRPYRNIRPLAEVDRENALGQLRWSLRVSEMPSSARIR